MKTYGKIAAISGLNVGGALILTGGIYNGRSFSYNSEQTGQHGCCLALAGVAESADATDLKSVGEILVGSSPTPGTITGRIHCTL